jgi:hypothetical protein
MQIQARATLGRRDRKRASDQRERTVQHRRDPRETYSVHGTRKSAQEKKIEEKV